MIPEAILFVAATGIAFRGKGGGFSTWGPFAKGASSWLMHGLGAVIVAIILALLTGQYLWTPIFVGLWILFTKPASAPCLDFSDFPTWKNFLRGTARQLLILPLVGLLFYLGRGCIWAGLGCLILGSLYGIGGFLNRKFRWDSIAFAESATGISGLILAGVYFGT